ncbi:unnamed protein product [Citrullus colocynthis]|uniref:Retrotransposon Copia-like N-terminal domain-containing protein n=1 Tax=Citrullus colocynthis TaxID=252529 RepID=A0ABP0YZ77_9ROSI
MVIKIHLAAICRITHSATGLSVKRPDPLTPRSSPVFRRATLLVSLWQPQPHYLIYALSQSLLDPKELFSFVPDLRINSFVNTQHCRSIRRPNSCTSRFVNARSTREQPDLLHGRPDPSMEKHDVLRPITTVLDGTNYITWAHQMRSFLIG